jgi:SAM-dependent methyltransferase
MNPEEYENLCRLEREHWYYSGKAIIVRNWIKITKPLRAADLLVDCGAGTGFFASQFLDQCRVCALDDFEDSLAILRQYLEQGWGIRCSAVSMPLKSNSADVVTALDALEHIKCDKDAAREFFRVLKPGGLLVITVPALMLLWSDWDVALHHYRRYNKQELHDLIEEAGFKVLHIAYTNFFAFPIVFIARKLRILCNRGKESRQRFEDVTPPNLINKVLRWLFVASAVKTKLRFPCGVSLLLVALKPVQVP